MGEMVPEVRVQALCAVRAGPGSSPGSRPGEARRTRQAGKTTARHSPTWSAGSSRRPPCCSPASDSSTCAWCGGEVWCAGECACMQMQALPPCTCRPLPSQLPHPPHRNVVHAHALPVHGQHHFHKALGGKQAAVLGGQEGQQQGAQVAALARRRARLVKASAACICGCKQAAAAAWLATRRRCRCRRRRLSLAACSLHRGSACANALAVRRSAPRLSAQQPREPASAGRCRPRQDPALQDALHACFGAQQLDRIVESGQAISTGGRLVSLVAHTQHPLGQPWDACVILAAIVVP